MNKLKRAVIKEELVELTGNYKSALILNQFIYWIERMKDTDKYIQEEKERSLKSGIKCDLQLSCGWIYKSVKELNEELMLDASIPTLRKYIKELVAKGYINERRNPIHKWDKTLQYRVDLIKVQMDLMKLGYVLEGYPLLAKSTSTGQEEVKDQEEVKENEPKAEDKEEKKKAPADAEDLNNFNNNTSYTDIISDNANYIPKKDEIKQENISNDTKNEAIELINKSCVAIKKTDLNIAKEEFTDIEKLKKALTLCENKEQNGIKALRLAYRNLDRQTLGEDNKQAYNGNKKGFNAYEGSYVNDNDLDDRIKAYMNSKF